LTLKGEDIYSLTAHAVATNALKSRVITMPAAMYESKHRRQSAFFFLLFTIPLQ